MTLRQEQPDLTQNADRGRLAGTAPTYKASCPWGWHLGCEGRRLIALQIVAALDSTADINWRACSSAPANGRLSFSASATLPLSDMAPAIDTEVTIEFGMSSSRIYGYHDNMPKHEAYIGNYPGLFYKVYESSYFGFAQLPCLSASPSAPRPAGCGVYFNAGL